MNLRVAAELVLLSRRIPAALTILHEFKSTVLSGKQLGSSFSSGRHSSESPTAAQVELPNESEEIPLGYPAVPHSLS